MARNRYPKHEVVDYGLGLVSLEAHRVSDGKHTGEGKTAEAAQHAYEAAIEKNYDFISDYGIFRSHGKKLD